MFHDKYTYVVLHAWAFANELWRVLSRRFGVIRAEYYEKCDPLEGDLIRFDYYYHVYELSVYLLDAIWANCMYGYLKMKPFRL